MRSCALLVFVVSTALVAVCMCISAVSKETKKLMDTLPHEPEKIDSWFFWDSRALKQTIQLFCFETVQDWTKLLFSCFLGAVQHFGN